MKSNVIQSKSYKFALSIIKVYKILCDQKEFVLSKQLLRSGTSIGANVEEAIGAQTKKDFTAKMSIASKEARETNYWLRLLRDSGIAADEDLDNLIGESVEVIKILSSIVKTSQESLK